MTASRLALPGWLHDPRLKSLSSMIALALVATACSHGGPKPDEPHGPAATPIAAARGNASGTRATVEGYVSVPPGAFVSALEDEGFAVQDETGGLYVKVKDKQAFGLGAHDMLEKAATLVEVYPRMRSVELDLNSALGRWTLGLALVKESTLLQVLRGSSCRSTTAHRS